MDTFRDALRPPDGGTEREGVLGDLAEYYGLTPEVALRRCLTWEQASIEEWEAAHRDTREGLSDFYATVTSWSFDLLWYSYVQASGFGYPKNVIIADRFGTPQRPKQLLDLGSGVGATAQMFTTLGYDVTLADVSSRLLEFARWRLDRRGVKATYLQLPAELPARTFDAITALDVMVHIPAAELSTTVRNLHQALRPGGLLVADYDVRRRSRANAWHLHDDDLPLRWAIEREGFIPVTLIDGIVWIYRAVPTDGIRWKARTALTWLRLASPLARAIRRLRRELARLALVTFYRLTQARRSR
ncbi:class I SAM-dependent methyltransferase [Pseudonocardia sp. GCM10023141]|uniref:class I SAM-dependent methyltransferase n=1 Tax=Pseudonocardia sp. GCM10023141 TaxID=3252653 RepID=UPI003623CC5B